MTFETDRLLLRPWREEDAEALYEYARDLHCVSFSPNGDVLGGNVYERDVLEILKEYKP